jgi:hypothetical protein
MIACHIKGIMVCRVTCQGHFRGYLDVVLTGVRHRGNEAVHGRIPQLHANIHRSAPLGSGTHLPWHRETNHIGRGEHCSMSEKHPECPLYNPLNCKEYYNPKLCAFVKKDKVCLKKKKPKTKAKK